MSNQTSTYRPTGPSKAAITSLILGLLQCIPILTGLAAIIMGALVLRAAKTSSSRGRGLAIAGILLGIVNILAWSGTSAYWWITTGPERSVAYHFVNMLCENKTAEAVNCCTPNVHVDQINRLAKYFSTWNLSSTFVYPASVADSNGVTTGNCEVSIIFSNGRRHALVLTTIKQNDGTWKIDTMKDYRQ